MLSILKITTMIMTMKYVIRMIMKIKVIVKII